MWLLSEYLITAIDFYTLKDVLIPFQLFQQKQLLKSLQTYWKPARIITYRFQIQGIRSSFQALRYRARPHNPWSPPDEWKRRAVELRAVELRADPTASTYLSQKVTQPSRLGSLPSSSAFCFPCTSEFPPWNYPWGGREVRHSLEPWHTIILSGYTHSCRSSRYGHSISKLHPKCEGPLVVLGFNDTGVY